MIVFLIKNMKSKFPITFSVDYPNRTLNRLTTFCRIIIALPIFLLLSTVSAAALTRFGSHAAVGIGGSGGLLFLGPLLMILLRQKYPHWWFDWNLELLRFTSRVVIYIALMDDQYPSTDEEQSVHLNISYPNVQTELSRWLPLIKWFLAIPHYFVLFFLNIAAAVVTIIAWFMILATGQYPKLLFDFVVDVMRWNLRVVCYAYILVTDEYPPFNLKN
jgi:hypothetical protein